MTKMELFYCYYDSWKIISDYIDWVTNGGESFYGSVEVARDWASSLFAAQNNCISNL